MAIYRHATQVEPIGYQQNPNNTYDLCCRYATGYCEFFNINQLYADGGLAEIEAALQQFLGWSPWNKDDHDKHSG